MEKYWVIVLISFFSWGCSVLQEAEFISGNESNRKSVYFNGELDQLSLGTANSIFGSTGDTAMDHFTFSLWYKATSSDKGWILSTDANINAQMLMLYIDTGDRVTVRQHFDSADNSFISAHASHISSWTHIVFTYDRDRTDGEMRLYLDGQLVEEEDVANYEFVGIQYHTQGFYLGTQLESSGDPDYFYAGKIDDVAIWNKSLSNSEVLDIYRTRGRVDLTENYGHYENASALKGWWRMGDDNVATDLTVVNRADSGADATCLGFPGTGITFKSDVP